MPAANLNMFRRFASEPERVHPQDVPVERSLSNAQVRSSDEVSAPTTLPPPLPDCAMPSSYLVLDSSTAPANEAAAAELPDAGHVVGDVPLVF
jgi:hypothetical protein